MDILQVLFWSTFGSVVSLIGGLLLIKSDAVRSKVVRYALPFGAGALLATAFVGLIPEAIEGHDVHQMVWYIIGGFLSFFVLERLLGWFHHHHHDDVAHDTENRTHTALVIVGDTLHNAIDGVAIGAAFLLNPAAGIATSIAVAAHELPQEIGDFGILLGKGMKPKKVILVNVLSALATVVTAVGTYIVGSAVQIPVAPLLALTAGFFIYIAASDIIPDIHEKPRREGNIQAIMLLLGVVMLSLVTILTSANHSHGDDLQNTHDHSHIETHDEHDQ